MLNKGIVSAGLAYLLWGFFPIFWKLLKHVPALETLGHRIVWAFAFMALYLTVRKQWGWLGAALRSKRVMAAYLAAGCLLGINWFVFIWAVNAGFIVETSLGYFINPLFNVLLGVLFLKERARSGQRVAIGIAAAGVAWLTISYGALPWIALTLAFTFGLYGLLKKTSPLRSTQGLTLEMGILFLPAAGMILLLMSRGEAYFGAGGLSTSLLLVVGGLVTALPLVLFAVGAKSISLVSLGILQYIAPTLQFLIGVFVYKEPFSSEHLLGFGLIWAALLLYTIESVNHHRHPRLRLAD